MKRKVILILVLALAMMVAATTGVSAKSVKAKSVTVSPQAVTIAEGDVVTLKAAKKPAKASGKLTWTSSDEQVATVKAGVVTGLSEGSTTITVSTTNKKTASCEVTVKKYMTKAELLDAIGQNTISEDAVKSIIKGELGNYYNKEETSSIIQDTLSGKNFITGNDAKGLINEVLEAKNYLTKSDASNYATKDQLGSYATKDQLGSYAKKDDLNSYITGDEAQQLISQNTLTEEDVIALIQQYAPSGGSDPNDWEDGSEVPMYSGQSLPAKFDDIGCVIETVSVKRYHVNDYVSGTFFTVRYETTVTGTTTGVASEIDITDIYRGASLVLVFRDISYGDGRTNSCTISGNNFTITHKCYAYSPLLQYVIGAYGD